jgi:ATP-dependent Lon protease
MSNSVILNAILDFEKSELNTTISSFIDSKLNEFKSIMKENVETIIGDKITNFYGSYDDQYDDILFDTDINDPSHITNVVCNTNDKFMEKCREYFERELEKSHDQGKKYIENVKSYIKSIDSCGSKCFILKNFKEPNSTWTQTVHLCVFKKCIIQKIISPSASGPPSISMFETPAHYRIHKHSMSNDILFTIKHFQLKLDSNTFNLSKALKIYEDHPEYFKPKFGEFENICKREYAQIEKTKEELQIILDANGNREKLEYYKSLEIEIADIENQRLEIQREKKKIKEEKQKLDYVKQKLIKMKADIDNERKQFESEKTRLNMSQLDIDKYLSDV